MKLQIATYNILFGHDARVFASLKHIRSMAQKRTPFLLGLQEVRLKSTQDRLKQKILRIFAGFSCAQLIAPAPTLNDLGLMTLSNITMLDHTPVLLPKLKKTPLNVQSYFLKAMPLHGALITRYRIGKKIVRFTNLHLNVMGGIPHKKRQIRIIREYLAISTADIDIVAGDFNTIGPLKLQKRRVLQQKRAILKFLGKDFQEVFIPGWTSDVAQVMSPLIPGTKFIQRTFKKTNIEFRQKLDWIFVRGAKRFQASVHHDLAGSDHYPVVASIYW